MNKTIKKTWSFDCSPQQVWRYLTEPELIEQWLMKTDFRAIAGQKFKFTFTESDKNKYAGVVECEVLEVVTNSRLSYTWNGKLKDGTRTFNSTVRWMLEPKKDGTQLSLIHDGFGIEEDMLAHQGGWDICIGRMEKLLTPAQV